MSTPSPAALRAEHALSHRLNAGAIDKEAGVIRGATVAQAGVEATGKFVFLDKEGNLTRDPKLAVRKLKVVTDEKTLDTLMEAVTRIEGLAKVRSDHDDSLESRAGYANTFRKVPASQNSPARVITDLHLNESYRDRDIVLETAQKTPKLIGLSIDYIPSFEIVGDKALMRVEELLAVDIVDEGAITHDGLFLSRGVDTETKVTISEELKKTSTMADDKKTPTLEECMAAIGALTSTVTALAGQVSKMASPEAMSAAMKPLTDQLSAVNESVLTLKKEQAAMGLKIGKAEPTAEELESQRLAAEKAEKEKKDGKTYLQLVDEAFAAGNGKLKKSDAHRQVMNSHPEKYAAHQKGLGVYDASKDTSGRATA